MSNIPVTLEQAWATALSGAPSLDDALSRGYAQRMAAAYVELADAAALGASEFHELGIPIGHRKLVRECAASAAAAAAAITSEDVVFEASPLIATPPPARGSIANDPTAIEGTQITVSHRNNTSSTITWVDVFGSAPSIQAFFETIQKISGTVSMHSDAALMLSGAFADNKPMPMFVSGKCSSLLLLRLPDMSNETGTTLASITNRLILWWPTADDSVLLSYHRCDVNPLSELMREWEGSATYAKASRVDLFSALVRSALRSYRTGIKQLQRQYEAYEDLRDAAQMIRKMTVVQKQAVVFHRCLIALEDVFDEMETADGLGAALAAQCNQHSASVETLVAQCNELSENISSTINLQVALDGFRAGDNMKIFTYISVLCQPIAVATGWYGMNFDNMPDLHYENSYFVFMGIVGGIVLILMMGLVARVLMS